MLNTSDIKFIKENSKKSVNELLLKYHNKEEADYKFLIQQISAREKVKKRLPAMCENDFVVFPPSLNLEQCSSEITAKYKQDIVKQLVSNFDIGVDLTAGFGVDALFIGEIFKEYHHIEPNEELLKLSENNYKVLDKNHIKTFCTTAENFLSQNKDKKYDFIYLDPSRRDEKSGEKVVLIDSYSPNLIELEEQLLGMSENILVKTSPVLDYNDTIAKVKSIAEVHIVSVKNEVKEVLYFLKRGFSDVVKFKTINFINDTDFHSFDFSLEELKNARASFGEVQTYLYETNASIMKSLAFNLVSEKFNLCKLHNNSHLYTSNNLLENFAGRVFKIIDVIAPKKKELKSIKKAHIACRNFAMSVEEIRKKFGIKEGGETYIFATTLLDEKSIFLVCEKV